MTAAADTSVSTDWNAVIASEGDFTETGVDAWGGTASPAAAALEGGGEFDAGTKGVGAVEVLDCVAGGEGGREGGGAAAGAETGVGALVETAEALSAAAATCGVVASEGFREMRGSLRSSADTTAALSRSFGSMAQHCCGGSEELFIRDAA